MQFPSAVHRRRGGIPSRLAAALPTALLAAFLVAGCGGPDGAGSEDMQDTTRTAPGAENVAAEAADADVVPGIRVLFRDSLHVLEGRRVGLITNHTGVSAGSGAEEPESTIDLLHRSPDVDLVALYSPEHGISGRAEAGERVGSGQDAATGLPIHSLYSTDQKPTPAMLEDVDILVFDIQDIGARYYTYVWTMALAMEAAGEQDIPFVVLDRPNPIGGSLVQGNVLDPQYATFVGLHPVAMRHGLTAGELARMVAGEFGVDVDLTVIPMDGWSREMWYDATGMSWVAPSPNMPSLASATHYPGTCLFEGTNLSVGRGTDLPFQQVGAPWLDAREIARRLEARSFPGVRFEAVTFTPESPGDRRFDGQEVTGIRFVATDRERYDPTLAAIAVLVEIQRAHPDQLEWVVSHFDRLAGTDRVRTAIVAGASAEEIVAPWEEERRGFQAAREPYLLYR